MPERIQRRRAKGWRMPEGAIYVGRPAKWGNPFTVRGAMDSGYASNLDEARQLAVDAFHDCLMCGEHSEWWFAAGAPYFIAITEDIDELRGHDLACWCPLVNSHDEYVPCHADVLLSIANDIPIDEVVRENTRRATGKALR